VNANSTLLNTETTVRIAPGVYARPFGEEIVLLEFTRGDYYGLDEIGAEVWRGLEAGLTVGAIADTLVARYEVGRADAVRDVSDLISELRKQALVEI
jgi:hypothetical protein